MSATGIELLTIDVEEELRKLSSGGLAGAWEVPTELVRWACARGAARVAVELERHRLRFAVPGVELETAELDALADLLDAAAPARRRHAALLALEPSPATAWIGLLAFTPRAARLESGRRWLGWGRGRPSTQGTQPPRSGLILTVGGTTDLSPAAAWLRSAARFAPTEILLDGRPVERGFESPLAESELPAPLSGRVALVPGGRSARLVLTVDGILAAHMTVPEAPPFEAVLAADAWVPASRSRAALREGTRPHLAAVVDAALDLMLNAARSLPPGPSPAGAELRAALLQAARRRLRLGVLLTVPLLDAWREGRWTRLSLLEAGQLARAQGGWLEALAPGDEPASSLARGPLLALGAEERARLAELLGARFALPPRRSRSRPRRLRQRLQALCGACARGISRATAGPLVPAACLTAVERGLLAALESGLRSTPQAAHLRLRPCRGRGRPFLSRHDPAELWLPLDAPELRRTAAAAGAGPLALAVTVLTGAGWRG